MSESAGHDPGKRGRTLDALSTISGVMLSPFRLPPAARPLGTAPKSLRGRSHGSTPAVTPSGRLFTGTTAGGVGASSATPTRSTANSTPSATSAPPWARGDGIRAGVPGSAAGGPAPPPMPTELLMQSPTVGRATPTSDAKRQQLRKRHLVEIGTYLWRFGLYRGLWCAGLLAFAVLFPLIVAPPSGLELSGMQPPYFLSTWAGAYPWAMIVGIAVAVVAALALPMFLRGLVLTALGMAPFAAYVIAFNSGHAMAIPPELSGYTKLGYILFPAWVGMAAGMVVGQNFPDYMLGRALAGVCAIIVLFYQVINPGVLVEAITTRTIAIEGLLGILVFALTLTAIGQFFAASMAVSFSFVKAGLVYVVGLPVIFAIFSHFGPVEERLADGSAYLGLHALLIVLAAFLMAVVGISELLHFFAFRSEVRAKLGHSFTRVKPTEPAFKQQFVIHCEKSGIYNSAEVDYLRTQLLL